jgi:hypothetical protein
VGQGRSRERKGNRKGRKGERHHKDKGKGKGAALFFINRVMLCFPSFISLGMDLDLGMGIKTFLYFTSQRQIRIDQAITIMQ